MLLNYLTVGSQRATEAYAEACLDAEVSLINCIPVFIASDPRWAARFTKRGLPLVGDDPEDRQAINNWNGDWDKWDNWDQWDQNR